MWTDKWSYNVVAQPATNHNSYKEPHVVRHSDQHQEVTEQKFHHRHARLCKLHDNV